MVDRFIIAAVQAAPVYLDRPATLEKATRLIVEAARTGACLADFEETWLPVLRGFDTLCCPQGCGADYLAQAVAIPGPETDVLCDAARVADIDIVIGVADLDQRILGTIYCTMLGATCRALVPIGAVVAGLRGAGSARMAVSGWPLL